jgi:hypothetical protein
MGEDVTTGGRYSVAERGSLGWLDGSGDSVQVSRNRRAKRTTINRELHPPVKRPRFIEERGKPRWKEDRLRFCI